MVEVQVALTKFQLCQDPISLDQVEEVVVQIMPEDSVPCSQTLRELVALVLLTNIMMRTFAKQKNLEGLYLFIRKNSWIETS